MSILVILVGVALIALAGALPERLPNLRPAESTASIAASVRLGLAIIQLGLVATASPVLLPALGGHRVASVCAELLGPRVPGGDATAWASAAALTFVVFARWRARHRLRRIGRDLRIERWIGVHDANRGVDHVTIPLPRPIAYAVPGPDPQIVVSEGLRRTCDDLELQAILRHEASHLRHKHERAVRIACELEEAMPFFAPARRTAGALRLAVERTADEDAICEPAHRGHVRTALLKVAVPGAAPTLAFLAPDTILGRLDALEREETLDPVARRRSRALLFAPLVLVAAGAAVWMLSVHHLVLGFSTVCW